jgi:hypothetical protein
LAKKSRKRRRRRPTPDLSTAPAEEAAAPDEAIGSAAPERAAARRAARRRSADPDVRPPAPWEPFPLIELLVLLALGLLVAGFVIRGHRGTVMIGIGLVLGSVSGLELSIREHFGGYRSHTALLAGAAAIVVLIGTSLLLPSIPAIVRILLSALAFAGTARFLVRVFQRRSGLSFKFR